MGGLTTPSTGRSVNTGSTATSGRNTKQSKWMGYLTTGAEKAVSISDWAAPYVNGVSQKFGAERFWPSSGDYIEEINKCTRILNGFTQDGFVREEEQEVGEDDPEGKKVVEEQTIGPDGTPISKEQAAKLDKGQTRTQRITRKIKKVKIIRKIPPEVLKKAKGIAIYTSMRSGMAPFGGSGGSGIVMSRLSDGSWSGPSFITPQNMSAGLMFGLDVYDVVLLIMSDSALEGFKSHKVTLGAETAIAAGPVGTGAGMDFSVNGVDWNNSKVEVPEGEKKKKMAKPPPPLFSYTRNRGFYGGIEGMAMLYLTRFDENERVYHWPGVTGRDVLEGRVRKPVEARVLYDALSMAESGQSQATESTLQINNMEHPESVPASAQVKRTRELVMDDGQVLELPLTPDELEAMEHKGIKGDDEAREEADHKAYVWSLPAPPRHPAAQTRAAGITRTKAGKRFVAPSTAASASTDQPARSVTPPAPSTSDVKAQPEALTPSELLPTSEEQETSDEPPPAYETSPNATGFPAEKKLVDPAHHPDVLAEPEPTSEKRSASTSTRSSSSTNASFKNSVEQHNPIQINPMLTNDVAVHDASLAQDTKVKVTLHDHESMDLHSREQVQQALA